jgi:hypothetical protein
MAHCGDGGAPPCGCWNACGRRIDGSHAYGSAAFMGWPAGACCSTAHYRRDDRAPVARAAFDHEGALLPQCSPGAAQFAPPVSHGLPPYSQGLS